MTTAIAPGVAVPDKLETSIGTLHLSDGVPNPETTEKIYDIVRFGAIASFICDDGRYLLASYFQEDLKYVTNGQPVEMALNLYLGQIFRAKVDAIWSANGDGQFLPRGTLPKVEPRPPKSPQNCYAVEIVFDDADQSKFTIGAQGSAAIYTNGMKGPWAALRRVGIRTYSWMNWLYPLPF
jgi:hypothetical protein